MNNQDEILQVEAKDLKTGDEIFWFGWFIPITNIIKKPDSTVLMALGGGHTLDADFSDTFKTKRKTNHQIY